MTPRAVAALVGLLAAAACAETAPPPPPPPRAAASPAPAPAAPPPAAPAAPVVATPPAPPIAPEPAEIDVRLRSGAEVAVEGPWEILGSDGRSVLRQGDSGFRGPIEPGILRPREGQGFRLDGRPYAGSLVVGPALLVINRVRFPDYLAGVLAGELFPDSPPESLRALAVLARSFALSHLDGLTDDPGIHQAYRGKPPAASMPALRAAVESTEGLRLVAADGSPLPGYWYHSTCGGRTADASLVFGVPATAAYSGVECPHCTSSKYSRWELEVPEEDLRKAIRFGSPIAGFAVARRSPDGRVVAFRAVAAGGTVREIPALEVRAALGPNRLRSTLLGSVEAIEGRTFLFKGRGWGHGVGLCQIGAMEMARRGKTAEEILVFYYPGARLVRPAR